MKLKADKGTDTAKIRSALRASLEARKELPVSRAIAFGSTIWTELAPRCGPTTISHFEIIGNPNAAHAPASQCDILVWLFGDNHDDVLNVALAVNEALTRCLSLKLDQPGFVYRDSRDLTGFIDGTANPKEDARLDAALIPTDKPGARGCVRANAKMGSQLGRVQRTFSE
jgi:putative iron-dependent peroxidase